MGYTLYRQAPAPTSASSPPGSCRHVPVDYAATTSATAGRLLQALRAPPPDAMSPAWSVTSRSCARDAAAKRALWPRLRALRRAH